MNEVAELGLVREKLAGIPGSSIILEALFALAPVAFQIYEARGRSILTNQAFRDLFGSEPPPEYNILRDEIAAASGILGLVERAFAGEVISTPPFWYDPRDLRQIQVSEGRRVAITLTFFPLRDAAGSVTHVGSVVKDVTAEMERRAHEDRARGEAEFLARCSAALAGSLDFETTLQSLVRLVVPHLADWSVIDLIGEDGGLRRVATAHVDPAKEDLVSELRRRYPPLLGSPQPAARAMRDGQPVLLADVDDELIARYAIDDRHRELVTLLAPRSHLTVPLLARERVLGTISLAFAESGRRYGPDTLHVALDLAAIAALAVDNARLYQESRDAIRVREDFLSVAGHELKTPLTAVQINLELLARAVQREPARDDQSDEARGSREALARRLADVDRQMRRLGALVDQLLDVSRLAVGRLSLDSEEIDLAALAREIVGRVGEEAARSATRISLAAPAPVIGQWDRSRLDQVLSNLMSNAVKYGGGQPVDVEVRDEDDHAVISVRDRGIGVAPENHARIFDKFERAVSGRHFGGLGLGLWICRELVGAMHGTIGVDSTPGGGATFTVRLPRRG
jgi:signal transduction histidine kinase